jgi:hypothetical protein
MNHPAAYGRLYSSDVRFIIMGLSKDQWRKYYEEAFRILKPGGYIQSCEIDHFEFQDEFGLLPAFFDNVNKYHASKGLLNFKDGVIAQYKPIMEAAGFVDIKIYLKSFDHGAWRPGTRPFFVQRWLFSQDKRLSEQPRHGHVRMRFRQMPSLILLKTSLKKIFQTQRTGVLTARESRRRLTNQVNLLIMCTSFQFVIINGEWNVGWAKAGTSSRRAED